MFYKDLKGVPLIAYKQLLAEVKRRALEQLGIPESDLVIRSLRPEDIGISTPNFHKATGGTGWVNLANTYTIADNRFIGIYGLSDGSTNTSQLSISRSGSDARIWNIQALQLNENKLGYVDDPVIIDQNNLLTMQLYSLASATEKIRLFGVVAEKKGVLVSP